MDSSCQTVLPLGERGGNKLATRQGRRQSIFRQSFPPRRKPRVRRRQIFIPSPPTPDVPLLPRRGGRYQRLGIVGMHQAVGNFPSTRAQHVSPPPFNPGWPLLPRRSFFISGSMAGWIAYNRSIAVCTLTAITNHRRGLNGGTYQIAKDQISLLPKL